MPWRAEDTAALKTFTGRAAHVQALIAGKDERGPASRSCSVDMGSVGRGRGPEKGEGISCMHGASKKVASESMSFGNISVHVLVHRLAFHIKTASMSVSAQ
jgi:hypothetical protein